MSRDFSVDSYYNLATKLLHEGDTERAKGWLLKASELDPLNPEVKKTKGADFKDLMRSHQLIPPRPKAATPRNQVEVIQATERKTMKF